MNAVPRQAQLDSGRLPCPPQKPLLDIDVSLLFGDDSEVQIPDRADGGANNVEPCTEVFQPVARSGKGRAARVSVNSCAASTCKQKIPGTWVNLFALSPGLASQSLTSLEPPVRYESRSLIWD